MANGDDKTSVNIPTPLGPVSFNGKRTAEFISVLLAVGVGIMAYILWDHQRDARENAQTVQHYLKQNVEAQRMMNCLLSLPQEERYKEYRSPNSFCKSISQER